MIPHVEVVTAALYLLGGDQHAVDTEDIAIKAHELAPGRFSWKKYPEQVNLEIVRVSLSDAKKESNGAMVDGSGRTGWTLTDAGRRWADGQAERVLGATLARERADGRGGSIDERRWRTERARIVALPAWGEWVRTKTVSPEGAAAVFRVDAYAVGQLRSRKVARLTGMFADDPQLAPFMTEAVRVLSLDTR